MKTVYRIQDAAGRGPWRPGFSHKWVEDRADHDNLRPWIFEMGPVHYGMLFGERAGCGCLSPEGLRRWITEPEYRKLLAFGYRCVCIRDARILGESPTQVVFARAVPLSVGVEVIDLYATAPTGATP